MFAALLLLLSSADTLHVEGNQLREAGKEVVLRGVNIPTLESSNDGVHVFRSVRVVLDDWNANCIRLPLSQDRWFGKAEGQKDGGEDYRNTVSEVATYATQRGGYVILDLHVTGAGTWGKDSEGHFMPDAHSLDFWKDVARRYRGEGHVLFDLFSEPRGTDWKLWRDGGEVVEHEAKYDTPGMASLVKAIRSMRANNVLVVSGLDGATDLRGADLTDSNVAYAAHLYPWSTDWSSKVGVAAKKHPVIVTEMGANPETDASYATRLFGFLNQNNLSWTASNFHPTLKPCLLTDWRYTPSPWWGKLVQTQLTGTAQ